MFRENQAGGTGINMSVFGIATSSCEIIGDLV